MDNFGERIRKQREEKGLLLRHVAASMDIDTALLSKIERGERKVKREQIILLAEILGLDKNKLITLWLADRVYEVLQDEELGIDALRIAEKQIKYNKQNR